MRPVTQLVHSRVRVSDRYALMPLEGFPASRLPTWPGASVRVLASPALGAGFVQYLIDLPEKARGEFVADSAIETFFYVLTGRGMFLNGSTVKMSVGAGHYGLTPPEHATQIVAESAMRILVLRKTYETAPGLDSFEGVYGQESQVPAQPWAENPHTRLQTLVPDELRFDLAMNIFTFDPGFGLPVVETHVMEHGALILQGKGLYYLGDRWMEVEKDDFLWMGPYCPQSFYAAGPTPAKYIYYKNVNRDIAL